MPERTTANDRPPAIPGLDADATPLLGIGLGLTGLVLGLRPRLAPLPLALTALTALLYRDPERMTPTQVNAVFAPIDGTVFRIDETYDHRFLHTDCMHISMTLSPIDVPILRSPATGVVRHLEYMTGDYRPPWDPEAHERNARTFIGIETDWGHVMLIQIAGPLARRMVCHVELGDHVEVGARIGSVRFGGRVDLLIQRDTIRSLLSIGQHVTGGMTPLAHITPL